MQSVWFQLLAVFAAQTKVLAGTLGVGWLDNPPLPLDLKSQGEKALFVIARGDKLIDQPGCQPERRTARVLVGAVSLTSNARAEADAMHFAARDMLKSLTFRAALLAAGGAHDLREVEVEPELRDIASPGAVLMSAFEIEYFQSYPSFAL